MATKPETKELQHDFMAQKPSLPTVQDELDAMDRNPPRVNPAHLWLGDVLSNTRDMLAKGRQRNQRKTHCSRGHAFDEANTYWHRGHRLCRACNAMHVAALKARRKAGDQ